MLAGCPRLQGICPDLPGGGVHRFGDVFSDAFDDNAPSFMIERIDFIDFESDPVKCRPSQLGPRLAAEGDLAIMKEVVHWQRHRLSISVDKDKSAHGLSGQECKAFLFSERCYSPNAITAVVIHGHTPDAVLSN